MQTAKVEGHTVKIGDWVCFKSDVEQSGKIVKINPAGWMGSKMLVLENLNGFHGDYIGGSTQTQVIDADCWVE